VEEARLHARLAGLNLLAVLQRDLGSLDRVAQIVKVVGLVNAVADFTDHPKVIDGCSELFGEVFGEAGAHARTAFGAGSLPGGMTVEVEAVVQIKP
jgi:enamine deaminase RidA (YjgF/YER057c/UK114 family)